MAPNLSCAMGLNLCLQLSKSYRILRVAYFIHSCHYETQGAVTRLRESKGPDVKTISLITSGTLIAAGAVIAPSLNFVPSYATVEVGENTVEATETFEGVRLEWELSDPQASIQILNNGEIVADADSSGSTVDLGALEGVAEYQVVVEEPAEIDDFESDVPEDIENFAHVVTVPLKIGDEVTLAARASGNTPVTTFRYQTFIPTKFVIPEAKCPFDLTGTEYYNGNNRNWNPWSSNVKTRFDASIDWRNGGSIRFTKLVGSTYGYAGPQTNPEIVNGPLTATDKDMVSKVNFISSSAANFDLIHDVTNPLCEIALGIHYSVNVRVWKASGMYEVSAILRKVPHHEFYVKDSDEPDWSTIWQLGYSGFNCLNPIYDLNWGCYSQPTDRGVRW